MIKAVIIDDESSCRDALQLLLKEFCPQVELLGMAGSLPEGINLVKDKKPELVFLDVELKNHLGFRLFESFPDPDFEVIFCTAHEKYALQAIKTSCIEYLLKPVDPLELMNAIAKFSKLANKEINQKKVEVLLENTTNTSQTMNKIAVPTNEGYFFINTSEIVYFEGDGKYTNMFTSKGDRIVSSRNLGEFEELLTDQSFFRCHKSWLINLNYIKKYVRSDAQVMMSDGKLIDVSVRKKEEFLKLFDKA